MRWRSSEDVGCPSTHHHIRAYLFQTKRPTMPLAFSSSSSYSISYLLLKLIFLASKQHANWTRDIWGKRGQTMGRTAPTQWRCSRNISQEGQGGADTSRSFVRNCRIVRDMVNSLASYGVSLSGCLEASLNRIEETKSDEMGSRQSPTCLRQPFLFYSASPYRNGLLLRLFFFIETELKGWKKVKYSRGCRHVRRKPYRFYRGQREASN